jgi:hypothetical protein
VLNGEGFIIHGGIPGMFAALEHEEEGTKDFMGDGDDIAIPL